MKQWYAVCTKTSAEMKVAAHLLKKGIETYLPLTASERRWQTGWKAGMTPLFPSLVFVRAAEDEHAAILQTPAVVNFYYWLTRPAVIREPEVEMIRRFLHEHEHLRVEKARINPDETGRLVSSAPVGEGGSPAGAHSPYAKLILPSLGYSLLAEPGATTAKPEEGQLGYPTDTPGRLALG